MTTPTPELGRQHDLEAPRIDERAFRQGWRIRTRLDALLTDQRITPEQWQAADRFRALWGLVFAIGGPRTPEGRASGANRGSDGRQIALLDLATRILSIERKIGSLAFRLVYLCAVEDRSWAEIGRRIDRDPHRAKVYTVLAIRSLARHREPPGRLASLARPITPAGTEKPPTGF